MSKIDTLIMNRLFAFKLTVYIICFLLGFVIFRSIYSRPPAVAIGGTSWIQHVDNNKLIHSLTVLNGNRDETIFLTRTFYDSNNPKNEIKVGGDALETQKGIFVYARTLLAPSWITGKWCLKTTALWNPYLAQRSFYYTLSDTCFELTEYD